MSIKQYPGGIVTKNPTAPTTSSAQGIWTLDQAQNYTKQGIWPRSPGAPTIGTATAVTSSSATVAFTAPSDLGAGSITYTATSSPGGITGTGTSPITVSGLSASTSYTFSVAGATPGGTGPSSAASNSITTPSAGGQQTFTCSGTFSWVAPAGVTSVSAVAIGSGGYGGNSAAYSVFCSCVGQTFFVSISGGGGGGGATAWANNITVTPGSSYTVTVRAGNIDLCQPNTSFASYVAASSGQASNGCNRGFGGIVVTGTGYGGGNGGSGSTNCSTGSYPALRGAGGGGAGGYASYGGKGGCFNGTGQSKTGGGGGGGGGSVPSNGGGGGGGTCKNGTLPPWCNTTGTGGSTNIGGKGVYGANNGGNGSSSGGGYGSAYGGGGGGGGVASGGSTKPGGQGGFGAVRIIWPGTTRQYPSTNTNDV